jgi:hypothetical protein
VLHRGFLKGCILQHPSFWWGQTSTALTSREAACWVAGTGCSMVTVAYPNMLPRLQRGFLVSSPCGRGAGASIGAYADANVPGTQIGQQ